MQGLGDVSKEHWPWGKHEGTLVEDLPSDYIRWVLENIEDPPFEQELQDQLELRMGHGVSRGRDRDA